MRKPLWVNIGEQTVSIMNINKSKIMNRLTKKVRFSKFIFYLSFITSFHKEGKNTLISFSFTYLIVSDSSDQPYE